MVILYIQKLNELAKLYADTGILDGLTLERPENVMVIEKTEDCVCSRLPSANFCVNGKTIIIKDDVHLVPCAMYYQISTDEPLDFETAVLWLVKSKFVTPARDKKFQNVLSNKSIFKKVAKHSCGCVEFKRTGIPIYCAMENVVLRSAKGITIREVVIKNEHN